jgi:hypothetical protein
MKLIVAVHNFANVPNDENFGLVQLHMWHLKLKHVLGKNFELTQAQALLELWFQWVQVCIMLEEV